MNALEFAREKHSGQTRRTGDPFILHPVRVAAYVELFVGESETLKEIALLHDVLEDTNTTYEELIKEFGTDVANGVFNLTNVYTREDYPGLKRSERKHREFERISQLNHSTKVIKLCDRLDNCMSMCGVSDEVWKAKYKGETKILLGLIGGACPEITKIIEGLL